jgi:hypothetical protein
MEFEPTQYGAAVARILALGGNGQRLIPLVCERRTPAPARRALKASHPKLLFPDAQEPEAPMAGLWIYFSGFDEAHALIDDPKTADGAFWHAILHRQEPDSANACYWFRQVGEHPAFPRIADTAQKILEKYAHVLFRAVPWNPFDFVQFCESARMNPGSDQEQAAREIQLAEWQILFDCTARRP